jgi:hypothetical protein
LGASSGCRGRFELASQPPQRLEDVAPGGVLARLHHLGDLAVREVAEEPQRHRVALLLGQRPDGLPDGLIDERAVDDRGR